MSIRILLVDDHQMMRDGLRSILDLEGDLEVVGEAANGYDALEMAQTLRPEVVVMDIGMKDLNGIDATRQIIALDPRAKVVALSTHSDEPYVLSMLEAGASGYVLKSCSFRELTTAIRAVFEKRTHLSPNAVGMVIEDYRAQLKAAESANTSALTPREREVLQLIAEGKSTKQIASDLHVSTKAIESNRRKIMEKLNSNSVADLVKYAIAGGLTSLEL